jgi:hypothetical protein
MGRSYLNIFLAFLIGLANPVGATLPAPYDSERFPPIDAAQLALPAYGQPLFKDGAGRQISYAGVRDANGLRVFKYIGTDAKYVQGGYINDNLANPTFRDIRWDSKNMSADAFRRTILGTAAPAKPGARPAVAPEAQQLNLNPAATGKFMDIYATGPRGINYYFRGGYQGGKDSLGRTLIFKFESDRVYGKQMVRLGTVLTDNGSTRVVWNGRDYLENVQAKAGVSSASAQAASASTKANAMTVAPKPSGSIVKGIVGTTDTYFYMGEVDSGLQKVWTYKPAAKGGMGSDYRVGTLQADGTVSGLKPFDPLAAVSNSGASTTSTTSAPKTPSPAAPKTGNLPAITDGITYDANAGKGASELNSPQSVQIYYRPSNLQRALGWTNDQIAGMKARVLRLVKGSTITPLEAPSAEETTDLTKVKLDTPGQGTQIAQGIGSFYALMGVVAVYKLAMNYPSNPMVLEEYLQSMNTMQILMLGTYMKLAIPFMRNVKGLDTAKGAVRSIPWFAAATVVGSIGISVIQTVATDPDSGRCLGISDMTFLRTPLVRTNRSIKEALFKPFDLPACDRLFSRYFSEDMPSIVIPQLLRAIPDTLFYVGTLYAFTASGLAAWMMKVPIIKSPLAQMVISFGLYFGARKATDWLITTYDNYRLSNAEATREEAVYNSWARFKNKMASGNSEAEAATLKSELEKYSNILVRWRLGQAGKMMQSFTKWTQKTMKYHLEIDASYELYSDFINRINWEKTTQGATPRDGRTFSVENIRYLGQARMMSPDTDPIYSEEYQNNTWKHIYNRHFFDYVVTSMACGPEVEGLGDTGVFHKIVSLYRRVVTVNSTPSQVVGDVRGMAVRFFPPKVVTPIDEQGNTVCQFLPGNIPGLNAGELLDGAKIRLNQATKAPGARDSSIMFSPEKFPIIPGMLSNRKSYNGLYDYIKDNVRQSILLNGENNFENWWHAAVDEAVAQEEVKLRSEYEKMLTTDYVPALVNAEYKTCTSRDLTQLSFYGAWSKLSSGAGGTCSSSQLKRLAYGILPNLKDELRLYLSMIVDLTSNSKDGEPVLVAAQNLMKAFEAYADGSTIVNGKLRPDIEALEENANTLGQTFRATFADASKNPGGAYTPIQLVALDIFDKRVVSVFDQTSTFYNILQAFEASAE